MANDVKVKISAEDQATEVLRNLLALVKQTDAAQRAANTSTRGAQQAASGAADAFSQMGRALANVGAALAGLKVVGFVKGAIDAADALHDLAQRTGVSAEALSVFQQAGEKAGASSETVAIGFKQLAKSVENLRAGNQEAVAAFGALGLSAAQLKGLSLDQVFVKVADAQAKFADGSGKSAVAMKLFGRSGDELLPLLHDLANGGFDQATARARELGSVIGTDAANAADKLNDSISDLTKAARGFANVFVEGVISPLTSFVTAITNGLASINPALKAFIVGATVAGGAAIALAGALGALRLAFAAFAAGTPVGLILTAISLIGGAVAELLELMREAKTARDDLDKDPLLKKAVTPPQPPVRVVDPAQQKAAREARLKAAQQAAQDELGIAKAQTAQTEEIESQRFAQGLTGLREFYDARGVIIRDRIAAEQKALAAELSSLRNAPLPEDTEAARVTRKQQIASIEARIKELGITGETELLALLEQERQARQQIADQVTGFENQIRRARGQNLQADLADIETTSRKFAEALAAQGGRTKEEIAALVQSLSTVLTDRSAFASQQQLAETQLNALATERANIEERARQGIISQDEAEREITATERARIPALQQAADLMRAFAERVGDPQLLQAANELQQRISGMGVKLNEAQIAAANLGRNIRESLETDLSNFLGDTINRVTSLGDAFRQLALSVVDSLQRIFAELAVKALFQQVGDLFGKAADTAAQSAAQGAAVTAAFAPAAATLTGAGAAVAAAGTTAGATLTAAGGSLVGAAAALGAAAAALSAAALASGGSDLLGNLLQVGADAFALGLAGGGFVRGPGSATSDSIPARLSAGEYVIRAAAVRKVGVAFLDALNGLRTPAIRSISRGAFGFASGGLVPALAGGGAAGDVGLHARIELDDGLILRVLGSKAGRRAVLETISDHGNSIKKSLGLDT